MATGEAAAFQAAANLPHQADGMLPKTSEASLEKAPDGGEASRINIFTVHSTVNREFAKCDLTTELLYMRTSKNVTV